MIGSLFSGIGGLELGLEAAGLGPVVWQVEQDSFCRTVLAKHWLAVDRSVTDVRLVTTSTLPRPRLICGGFPCQDVSGAGKGEGLAGARSGLWFVFRDIVDSFRPEAVIVENVASGKGRWLCQVRSDLHALGYRTRAVQISATDVGAPHLRKRIFVLAMADAFRELVRVEPGRGSGARGSGAPEPGDAREVANADSGRSQGQWSGGLLDGERAAHRYDSHRCGSEAGAARPDDAGQGRAKSGVGREPHGFSARLGGHQWPAPRGAEQHAWEPPRVIEGRKAFTPEERIARRYEHRRPRLKALGNAVVPQCAYVAGLVLRDWIEQEGRAA